MNECKNRKKKQFTIAFATLNALNALCVTMEKKTMRKWDNNREKKI